MLADAWGVIEEISPRRVRELKVYISTIENSQIAINKEEKAKILKADIKERKGRNMLIFRYQLLEK